MGRNRDLRDAEGQRFAAEKALHDADRHIETDAAAAREQAARYEALSLLAEQRRGAIAALETKVAGLLAKVEDRDDAIQALETSVAAEKTQRALVTAEHESLTGVHAGLTRDHEALRAALVDAQAKAAAREERLRGRTDALAAAETRITEQDAAMTEKDARLATLQKRFDLLMADLAARDDAADPGEEDARLRAAIVAAGDETLRLLATGGDNAAAAPASQGRS